MGNDSHTKTKELDKIAKLVGSSSDQDQVILKNKNNIEFIKTSIEITKEAEYKAYKKIAKEQDLGISLVESVAKDMRVSEFIEKIDQGKDGISKHETLASKTLKVFFSDGKNVEFSNKKIYMYCENFWRLISKQVVNQYIRRASDDLMFSKTSMRLVSETYALIEDLTAGSGDRFKAQNNILNFDNLELNIDDVTGKSTENKHCQYSNLLTRLSFDFDRDDQCSLFLRTIDDLFSVDENGGETSEKYRQEATDFLSEIIGYSIQTNKNIPCFFIFKGGGGNGKSTILNIIAKILKTYVIAKTADLVVNKKGSENTHETFELVGKRLIFIEEIGAGAMISDEKIKRLSANALMTVNPKNQAAFESEYIGTVFICANNTLRLAEIGDSLKRRLHVIPFLRQFKSDEIDISRTEKIIENEKAGVISWALDGLERMRKRGNFNPPDFVIKASEKWINKGNSVSIFVDERIDRTRDDVVYGTLSNTYLEYQLFCETSGMKALGKIKFSDELEKLDVKIYRGAKNRMTVYAVAKLDREEYSV